MAHQTFGYEQKSRRNGIYFSAALEKLKNLLEKEKYTTKFFNILLNQDNNKTELAIVTPNKFYKSFKELGEEPKVPDGTNENNIISFYKDNFTKYDGVSYNNKTFTTTTSFPVFETEVLLVSTLKKGYQDFDKPYTSVEFYANLKKDLQNNIVQSYFSIQPREERIKFLKRFVKDTLNKETNAGVVKNFSLNDKEIYTSKTDLNPTLVGNLSGVASKESNFEKTIPLGGVLGVPTPVAFAKSTQIQSINDIKGETYCSYDVLGYVITKKKGGKLIKRVYVLNDEDNFSGYLKYFDSQIIEDVSYSYNVEQINLIHGIEIEVVALSFPTNNPEKQKEFIKQKKQKNPSIEEIFKPFFPNDSLNWAEEEDNKSLPYYKDQDFQIKISSTIKPSKLVAYSPILSEDLDSPDLTLKTNIFQIKPSSPDVNIYAKKGESKNVLILISNLVGTEEKVTGLLDTGGTGVKIIDLGFDLESLVFPVKEYRVYRTEEEPTSYASFPSEPRKIVDPRNPDFLDDIEPNIEYYYYAEAIDIKNTKSNPSKILKLEMVQEQDHIFALLEAYKLGNKKEQVTEKIFKKTLSVSPTFLQSAVKNKIVGGYINTNKLFNESTKILDPNINPTHKLRVTSKKTRRRFDINTIFSYKEIKDFKELPPGAELVLEEPLPKPKPPEPAPEPKAEAPKPQPKPKSDKQPSPPPTKTSDTMTPLPATTTPPSKKAETNPCCKSKDFSYTKGGSVSVNEGELAEFQSKMTNAIIAVDGVGTDEKKLKAVMNSLTDAEKCFLCRRLYWGEGKSLYARFEEEFFYESDKKTILYDKIKCTKFGYKSDKGNVKGSGINDGSSIDILNKGKC